MGYHAKAGTHGGVMEHSISTKVIVNTYINNIRAGEIGIEASIAGYLDIPAALVTRCDKSVSETKEL